MNPVMRQTCAYINNMKSPARLIKEDILLLNYNIKNAQYISEKRQERPYSDLLKAFNEKQTTMNITTANNKNNINTKVN